MDKFQRNCTVGEIYHQVHHPKNRMEMASVNAGEHNAMEMKHIQDNPLLKGNPRARAIECESGYPKMRLAHQVQSEFMTQGILRAAGNSLGLFLQKRLISLLHAFADSLVKLDVAYVSCVKVRLGFADHVRHPRGDAGTSGADVETGSQRLSDLAYGEQVRNTYVIA